MPYSACVIVGGSVVTNLKTNCSKTIRKAMATTGMNEYWMNALNQPQNNHQLRHDKNGTKSARRRTGDRNRPRRDARDSAVHGDGRRTLQ